LPDERIELLGAPLDPVTLEEAVATVDRAVRSRVPVQHASLNAAKLVRLKKDVALREAIWGCDLVTADGQPVVWAARVLGHRVPERVNGTDLMEVLLAHAAAHSYRVYLLGARPDVLDDAAAEIRRRYPSIRIVGHHHGYFSDAEEEHVVREIIATRPDLMFIALETPQKELFLARHRGDVEIPFMMGVGGSFDVIAGRRKRAPRWAQRAGLEWFFRFIQEPRRLGRRYIVGNTRFIALVAGELLRSLRTRRARNVRA
jgi:N-acetylglucosaminyldiphosphoundecaprenol N-acetyl-beta-D-mannosaminyltransferase